MVFLPSGADGERVEFIKGITECYLCGDYAVDPHHVFAGARKGKSPVVYLCRRCHRNVQTDAEEMEALQKHIQLRMMNELGWTEERIIKEYGRTFI